MPRQVRSATAPNLIHKGTMREGSASARLVCGLRGQAPAHPRNNWRLPVAQVDHRAEPQSDPKARSGTMCAALKIPFQMRLETGILDRGGLSKTRCITMSQF